jgi:O-antigen ligase
MARDRGQIVLFQSPSKRLTLLFVLVTAGVVFAGAQCAAGNYGSAVVVAVAALGAGFLSFAPISKETVLLAWFATTPLASFFVRYPTDRSILTFNRAVFGLLAIVLVSRWAREASIKHETDPNARSEVPSAVGYGCISRRARFSLSKFEIAWAALATLALLSSILAAGNVGSATRIAVDTFWLPLVAFHIGKNYFDLKRRGKALLLVCIALALFLFASGAFEFATGIDLFRYKGSEIVREGERRVNGPFAADSSFAIICLMLFLFLQAAPRLFRVRLDRTARLIYLSALTSAALGALLPLFRAVAIALVVCWILLNWLVTGDHRKSLTMRSHHRRRLTIPSFVPVMFVALIGFVAIITPLLAGTRLTDSRTAFGRFATWQAAAEITLANPLFGVGLGNYSEYFDQTHYYSDEPIEEVLEARAVDSPHSNLMWIGAELGLVGLALYLTANACLFLIGWRAFKHAANSRQRAAAACIIALVVAYWIPGFTLTSGYYSDLNLYFFFLVGVLATGFTGSRGSVGPAELQ